MYKYEMIAEEIQKKIKDGTYPPDTRLPQEMEMMVSSLMTMLLKFLQLWNRIGCVELYVRCQLILLDRSVFLC